MATNLGIHVTSDLGVTPGPAPISDDQPPTRPGDNTPRIMERLGAAIMPGLAGRSQDNWDAKKVTGAARSSLTVVSLQGAIGYGWRSYLGLGRFCVSRFVIELRTLCIVGSGVSQAARARGDTSLPSPGVSV